VGRRGPAWAGRALGAQNTAQNIAAILTPPLLGVLIESTSYSTGFVVAAIFPIVAVVLTPVARRPRRGVASVVEPSEVEHLQA